MIFYDRLKYNDRFPWVNYGLITVNVFVFLMTWFPLVLFGSGDQIEEFYTDWGFAPANFSVVTLVSCMFLHGGLDHIIGNLLMLWLFGGNVERRLGHTLYLGFYLLTGICGTLLFATFADDPNVPLVGASGAISGVMGMYFVFFPRWKLDFIYGLSFIGWGGVFRVPAWLVMSLFFMWDLIRHFASGAETNVAHLAHIGGFLSAAGLAFIVRKSIKEQTFILQPDQAEEKDLEEEFQEPSGVIRQAVMRSAYVVRRSSKVVVLAKSHAPLAPDQLPNDGFIMPAQQEMLRGQIKRNRGLFFEDLEFDLAKRLTGLLNRNGGARYTLLPAERFNELPPNEALRDADFAPDGMRIQIADHPVIILPYRDVRMAVGGRLAMNGEPTDIVAVFGRRPDRRYILNDRILSGDMLRSQGIEGRFVRELSGRIFRLRKIKVMNRGIQKLSSGDPAPKLRFSSLEGFDTYTRWLLNFVASVKRVR